VYQHSDSGWSKYSDGNWNPVQPPANRPNPPAASDNTSLGAADNPRSSGAGGYTDHSNYQQLEQDRLGRQAGGGSWGGRSGGNNYAGTRRH